MACACNKGPKYAGRYGFQGASSIHKTDGSCPYCRLGAYATNDALPPLAMDQQTSVVQASAGASGRPGMASTQIVAPAGQVASQDPCANFPTGYMPIDAKCLQQRMWPLAPFTPYPAAVFAPAFRAVPARPLPGTSPAQMRSRPSGQLRIPPKATIAPLAQPSWRPGYGSQWLHHNGVSCAQWGSMTRALKLSILRTVFGLSMPAGERPVVFPAGTWNLNDAFNQQFIAWVRSVGFFIYPAFNEQRLALLLQFISDDCAREQYQQATALVPQRALPGTSPVQRRPQKPAGQTFTERPSWANPYAPKQLVDRNGMVINRPGVASQPVLALSIHTTPAAAFPPAYFGPAPAGQTFTENPLPYVANVRHPVSPATPEMAYDPFRGFVVVRKLR